jgi:hypothetical protein
VITSFHITDKDGVVGQVQQACLLRAFRHFGLKVVTGSQQFSFDVAPHGCETRDKRGEADQY